MRTRSKSILVTPTAFVAVDGKMSPYEANPINLGKTFNDFLTPGYFKALRAGEHLPVNPASSSELYFIPSGGTTKHEQWEAGNYNRWNWRKVREVAISGCVGLSAMNMFDLPSIGIGALPTFTEEERHALMTSAMAGALTQKMDILTFALEAKKTATLVAGVAGKTLDRAHKIRNLLTRKGLKNSPNEFAQAWLEARYGWRPLMFDIMDASQLVTDLMSGVSELRRSSKTSSKSGSSSSTLRRSYGFTTRRNSPPSIGSEYNPGIAYDHVIRKTGEVECRAGVMIRDSIRSYATVDPVVSGYELIPFSFVLDWFVNVGDFLTVISPFASAQTLHMYNTFTSVEEVSISSTPVLRTFGTNSLVQEFRASGSVSPIILGRQSWNREPVKTFEPTLGHGSGPSILKGLDALALLKGRIRSLRTITTI